MEGEKTESLLSYVSDSEPSSYSNSNSNNNKCRIMVKQKQQQQDLQASKAKWKDEDVIVLLDAVIEFQQQQTGAVAVADSPNYDFVKKRLWQGVQTSQISKKMKNLEDNFRKMTKEKLGELSAIDNYIFCLCEKIWGCASITLLEEKKDNEDEKEKESSCRPPTSAGKLVAKSSCHPPISAGKLVAIESYWDKYPYVWGSVDSSEFVLRDHLRLLGKKKGRNYDRDWLHLDLDQEELRQKMDQLEYDQTTLILNAKKKHCH